MFTRVFSSTIRNVTGSEFVHRASFLTGVFLKKSLLVDNMLTEACSVFEAKMCDTCAKWPRTSLDCDLLVAGFAFYHMLGPVRWSVVLASFGFLVYVLSLLAEVISKIGFSCASVVTFSKTATTTELTFTTWPSHSRPFICKTLAANES